MPVMSFSIRVISGRRRSRCLYFMCFINSAAILVRQQVKPAVIQNMEIIRTQNSELRILFDIIHVQLIETNYSVGSLLLYICHNHVYVIGVEIEQKAIQPLTDNHHIIKI